MAFDVLVRFTLNSDTYYRAQTTLEDLLIKHLNPTSSEFQPGPHSTLDSWSLWPEEERGVMIMRGPVSHGYAPRFVGEPLTAGGGHAASARGQRSALRCPLRDIFERETPQASANCPIQDP